MGENERRVLIRNFSFWSFTCQLAFFEHGSKSFRVCLDIWYPFQPLPLPIQSRRRRRRFVRLFLTANEILSVSSQDETVLLSPRSTSFDSPPFSNQKMASPLEPHFFKPLLPGFYSGVTIPLGFFSQHIEGKTNQKT